LPGGVARVRSEASVAIAPAALDADRWVLNVNNGAIDLRTGALHPHQRDDLCTKIVPIDYDPEATCPRWEQFLREIFLEDDDLIRFIHKAIGYSLTRAPTHPLF